MNNKNFFLGDLVAWLAPLSNSRRAAVLYALDTHGKVKNTVLLSWKEALCTPATDFARDLQLAVEG
jgi:hypothetical protein